MEPLQLTRLGASLPTGISECRFDRHTTVTRGKKRIISVPNTPMRLLHEELKARLTPITVRHGFFESAYGGIKGRSATQNAERHLGHRYFYQLDISNAYPSTRLMGLAQTLREIDERLGEVEDIRSFLRTFCAGEEGRGLAVGGPASPLLFNMFCASGIDAEIRALCSMPETCYTRYLDDITISSNQPLPGIFRKRVRTIIENAGFAINHAKSKVLDIQQSNVTVTGVLVTKEGWLLPTDAYIQKVVAALRTPMHEMTRASAYHFSGLTSHLFSFTKHREPIEFTFRSSIRLLPEHIYSLVARCKKRLAELRRRGLLPASGLRQSMRYFPDSILYEIRRQVSVLEVARRYLDLKKKGQDYVACCPFHGEKTPSFRVSPRKKIYHCFGCGVTGDVFDLIEHFEFRSFREAVYALADECGLLERLDTV